MSYHDRLLSWKLETTGSNFSIKSLPSTANLHRGRKIGRSTYTMRFNFPILLVSWCCKYSLFGFMRTSLVTWAGSYDNRLSWISDLCFQELPALFHLVARSFLWHWKAVCVSRWKGVLEEEISLWHEYWQRVSGDTGKIWMGISCDRGRLQRHLEGTEFDKAQPAGYLPRVPNRIGARPLALVYCYLS